MQAGHLCSLNPMGALVLAGLLAIGGCATKGDLEALRQEVKASAATVETLKGETRTGFEATKKQIEERERQLAQDLKGLQDALAKLSEVVKQEQAKVAESVARNDALAREAKELRSSVESAHRTLVEFLKTEEARLKEGLQWVQSVLKDLLGEGKSQGTSPKDEKPK